MEGFALPRAPTLADFYKGKQISLIIGTSSGNDYDFRARLLARHLGRFIPGNPSIVPRNMPGAGGINAANWLANTAPRDGATIHMIMANMMNKQAVGVPASIRRPQVLVDRQHHLAPNVPISWHTRASPRSSRSGARADHRRPAGTAGEVYGAVMNALVGTKSRSSPAIRRQRGQPRDGARRDSRPRVKFLAPGIDAARRFATRS